METPIRQDKNLDGIRKRSVQAFGRISKNAHVIAEKGIVFARKRSKEVFDLGNYSVFVSIAVLTLALFGAASLIQPGQKLKKQVLGTATAGLNYLDEGKQGLFSQDLTQAAADFSLAYDSFERARAQIQEAGGALSQLAEILPQGDDVDRLFQAGQSASQALVLFSDGLKDFENLRLNWDPSANISGQEFFNQVRNSRKTFVQGADHLESALALLSEVNPQILPENYREEFLEAGRELAVAENSLQSLIVFQDAVIQLFGGEVKDYLLLFQNNSELRATGGFIGTYGILHFENGQAKLEKIETVYNLDGQLQEKVAPPLPFLRLLTDEWGMRDSNWFVDFPASARKALLFYEKSTGLTADGAIAITPDIFEKLLQLTGPVAMPEYGETLTAENFRELVQYKTSLDYDRVENQPKKFLADFAPKFLSRFKNLDSAGWLSVLEILTTHIQSKQVLAFSLDSELQSKFERLGLGGQIKQTDGDYLAVYHSNVGGGKTNLGISESVEKSVFVSTDGKVDVELKIHRSHQAFNEEFFPENVDFMRILVPLGSRLTSASGFDDFPLVVLQDRRTGVVDPDVEFWEKTLVQNGEGIVYTGYEAGYTEFAGWLKLSPGESKTVILTYRLPFEVKNTYTQLVQKQPGSHGFDFAFQLSLPGSVIYTYPDSLDVHDGGIRTSEKVQSDRFYGVVRE